MAQDLTVSHCSIYDMPRAGINIGDGCWGGHVIEYCDVFDTVKESGDRGPGVSESEADGVLCTGDAPRASGGRLGQIIHS